MPGGIRAVLDHTQSEEGQHFSCIREIMHENGPKRVEKWFGAALTRGCLATAGSSVAGSDFGSRRGAAAGRLGAEPGSEFVNGLSEAVDQGFVTCDFGS